MCAYDGWARFIEVHTYEQKVLDPLCDNIWSTTMSACYGWSCSTKMYLSRRDIRDPICE